MVVVSDIAANIAMVLERMAAAARRAGRGVDDVTLMAVSKTFPASAIRAGYEAGVRLFGENYVQEFDEKSDGMGVSALVGPDATVHMIGHLQSNKAGKAVELFDGVDSVDSLKLAKRLDAAVAALSIPGKKLPVLIEINVGGEAAKSGVDPESPDLEALLTAAPNLSNLEFRGLMTIPPWNEDAEETRPYFRRMSEIRNKIAARRLPGVGTQVLSMGMSGDFEVAIAEGSTCVRVGTAIFGERPPAATLQALEEG